ncbi:YbaN family protein [Methylopila henanensis]|uniref:YbaN family protein n=1 Tax=Methylopila henanensis TaxID=873516 RepID=A0ABW4KE17_9HYPH
MRRNEGADGEPTPPGASRAAAGRVARGAWIAAGLVLVGLGIVGLVLPVMPGTVFLIAAAACFARGSPRLERWLLTHPRFGPTVVAWRRDGVIPLRAKMLAFAGMALSVVIVALSSAPPIALASAAALVAAGALYVGTRPSTPRR